MTPDGFRWLLGASLAFAVASGFLDTAFPSLLPEALSETHGYLMEAESESYQLIHWVLLGSLSVLVVGMAIVGYVGLFLFKRWGRQASVLSTLLAFPLYIPFSPMLQSGWSAMLMEASFVLWGAILAIAYFSPLKARFEEVRA